MTEETRELVHELALGRLSRWLIPAGWIAIGLSTLGFRLWNRTRSGQLYATLAEADLWLAFGPLCLATAVAFILRASWFRWAAYLAGGFLALASVPVSLGAFHPQVLLWWPFMAMTCFGIWTIVVGAAGFPRETVSEPAA
jgi:hypothetical protein